MKTRVYYNEIDPEKCELLRQLMNMGLIPEGDIDERSIVEVQPGDLAGYAQCHFFAGIAGWPYSLQFAGVPDLECWTGSCPCQPWSPAGEMRGIEDDRHLWPEWFRLVRICRPRLVFGEQVAAAIADGWLDLVCSNLETEGYACGSIVLGAHSVGAPHIRQRLYWVADTEGARIGRNAGIVGGAEQQAGMSIPHVSGRGGPDGELAHPKCVGKRHDTGKVGAVEQRAETGQSQARDEPEDAEHGRAACGVGNADGERLQGRAGKPGGHEGAVEAPSAAGRMADSDQQRRQLHRAGGGGEREGAEDAKGRYPVVLPSSGGAPRFVGGFWADAEWLWCRDEKYRPAKSGIFPLVDGLPDGMGRVRDPGAPFDANATAEARGTRISSYGDAIVPQVAAEFIRAYMESIGMRSDKSDCRQGRER